MWAGATEREARLGRLVRTPERDAAVARVSRAFVQEGGRKFRERAVLLESCCLFWGVAAPEDAPHLARPYPVRCWDRLCPSCARAKAGKLGPRLLGLMARARAAGRRPRFLTLTQRTDASEGPRAARRAIAKAFGRLRHRKSWGAHVLGWMAKYEETFTEGVGWHAHLHVILDGTWWDRGELAAEWEGATRGRADARVAVDIREAREGVERELLKYATKAATLPESEIVRYAREMASARDITTGGTWFGVTSDEDLQQDKPDFPQESGKRVTMFMRDAERRAAWGEWWPLEALQAVDALAAAVENRRRRQPEPRARAGPVPLPAAS